MGLNQHQKSILMKNAKKIINLPVQKPQLQPQTANAAWFFNADHVDNWAYWNGVFTPQECKEIIKLGEQKILEKATVINNKIILDARDSQVSWLYSADNMQWAYQKVTDVITSLNNQFFKFELFGFAEGFQFTKYEAPSGFYGAHIDKWLNGPVRKLSLTIQLSDPDDYEGGELVLNTGEKIIMDKEQGKLVCFPSYVLHEVRPVTKGTRYSLVAWITGTPFK